MNEMLHMLIMLATQIIQVIIFAAGCYFLGFPSTAGGKGRKITSMLPPAKGLPS